MNIFRLTGDLSHLAAIIILLLKIWKTRSCAVYLIYMKFKATYDGNHDTFRVEFLVVPVGGLSFLVNHDFSPVEILWTFSIYLESVAILPQLFMISKTGEAETITTHYLFFLGLYRALYLINWIWRYYFEGFFDLIAVVAGVVQTILYCDFFYLYVTKGIDTFFFFYHSKCGPDLHSLSSLCKKEYSEQHEHNLNAYQCLGIDGKHTGLGFITLDADFAQDTNPSFLRGIQHDFCPCGNADGHSRRNL
ncbi:hypothetical protein JRQ81_010223 [Phrynocephalus forsythii]|uniref:ER lumen protein-retaining receptor n=1 Tax=Phrynocephalus forsythii TaxID=171643 RepID=A0A9Q0XA53_9SAUR|nr:hypothetical protein JRQ81_010223 [Phrynocephalus forsythii]